MVEYRLVPHPDHPPSTVENVDVQVHATDEHLSLIFWIDGDPGSIVLPPPAKPYRTDELWRSTCFELFVRGEDAGYAEFNFSPSTQWAAYSFDAYRAGLRPLLIDEIRLFDRPPAIWVEHGPDVSGLWCGIVLGPVVADIRIGLSAVIEETGGTKSYWALAHSEGPPDFHHPACFAATLPAPTRE